MLPSTVDLYIDGLKQSSQRVTPGDFLLDTLPSFTGSGQAEVVITDINGQRRTVQLDLYGAPGMLAEGFSSGSLDIGWMRETTPCAPTTMPPRRCWTRAGAMG